MISNTIKTVKEKIEEKLKTDLKNIEKIALWALIISVAIVTISSVPEYILGMQAPLLIMVVLVKVFSFVLGGAFGLYLLLVILNGTWKNYLNLSIPAVVFWCGLIAVALLNLTGLGVGFYSGEIPLIPAWADLPQWIDQCIIPLRAMVFYMTIAVGIVCASLLVFKSKK